MASSNVSHFFRWCRSTICSSSAAATDNAETDLQHVTVLVKAFKAGTVLDGSYDPILNKIMKNVKSRDALITVVMDSMKLSQFMVANIPKAVDTVSDYDMKATTEPSFACMNLFPPYGTKGFSNETYKIEETSWAVNVHAYRWAHSDNVTLIILHSGSAPDLGTLSVWTDPDPWLNSHFPGHLDSTIRKGIPDGEYSYHIDYTGHINMIGLDGSPFSFKPMYKDTFTAQWMELENPDVLPNRLRIRYLAGRIYGMSVFNTSYKPGSSILINFVMSGKEGSVKVTV